MGSVAVSLRLRLGTFRPDSISRTLSTPPTGPFRLIPVHIPVWFQRSIAAQCCRRDDSAGFARQREAGLVEQASARARPTCDRPNPVLNAARSRCATRSSHGGLASRPGGSAGGGFHRELRRRPGPSPDDQHDRVWWAGRDANRRCRGRGRLRVGAGRAVGAVLHSCLGSRARNSRSASLGIAGGERAKLGTNRLGASDHALVRTLRVDVPWHCVRFLSEHVGHRPGCCRLVPAVVGDNRFG